MPWEKITSMRWTKSYTTIKWLKSLHTLNYYIHMWTKLWTHNSLECHCLLVYSRICLQLNYETQTCFSITKHRARWRHGLQTLMWKNPSVLHTDSAPLSTCGMNWISDWTPDSAEWADIPTPTSSVKPWRESYFNIQEKTGSECLTSSYTIYTVCYSHVSTNVWPFNTSLVMYLWKYNLICMHKFIVWTQECFCPLIS